MINQSTDLWKACFPQYVRTLYAIWMSQETLVKPEPYVKVCLALVALSLLTIAVCQVVLVLRPTAQPIVRRPLIPMENRMSPQGIPPFPQGTMPSGAPEGARLPQGNPPQSSEKPAKK